MKKIVFLIVAIVVTFAPVFARNWVEVANKVYIDADSVEPYIDEFNRQKPSEYIYWSKELNNGSQGYKDLEKDYNKKVWYTLNREIVSCSQKTLTLKVMVVYDLKGNLIEKTEVPSYAMQPSSVVPDSLGELLFNSICGG